MRIGVDFDNTMVTYDTVFHRVALEKGLIPSELPVHKSEVRNFLRRAGLEEDWTELQGYVYGARMAEAEPFPGLLEFFASSCQTGLELLVISHKTRWPYRGPPYDLHASAMAWLEQQGLLDRPSGLPRERVFFELTQEQKLARIAAEGCSHFVDDLPEFLAEPGFPSQTRKVLFDPHGLYPDQRDCIRFSDWRQARGIFS